MGSQQVFIIDDDVAACEAVAALSQARGVPARGFGSAEEFLAKCDTTATGCVVTETQLPGVSGAELLGKLKELDSPLPVIVLTAHADVSTAVRMMQAGASTVLPKPCNDGTLWRSIETALEREREKRAVWERRQAIRRRLAALSAGEHSVLMGLLAGNPNKRIALDLGIGLRTVELRRAKLLKKMQAGSLAELVRLATYVDLTPPSAD